MVNYSCSKCNKVFKQKGHYKAHLNKKFPCSKKSSNILNKEPKKTSKNYKKTGSLQNESEPSNVGGYECEYCHIIIKRKDNLNRHYNRCKSKTNNVENDLKEKMFELLLTKMEKQEENYEKRIELLQEQISKLNTNTINYNTYNTTNNTQNIQVLAYDKTDMSHLKDRDYNKVLRRGNFCVPNLVDAIHFNPNKPENHNIYIPNMKTGFIMCWNGKSWDIRNREDVIDDIYDDKSNLLIDKLDEWEDIGYKLDPIIMTKFKRFLGKMDDDIVKNKVKEEIRFLLYNKRNLINKNK
jgi:hypothetical protein